MSFGGINAVAAKKLAAARREVVQNFKADPWVGYDSLEKALDDYKCTTQAEVLARLLNRENVFISGPAGSGKTTLINNFIKLIDAEYDGAFEVALTASTGIAATLLEGKTIHSWAGLGIDTAPFDEKHINPMMARAGTTMRYADVLIIDEISMLPAYLFEKLDQVLQHYRKSEEAFGGIQLIVMGDFLQLPPVNKKEPGVDAGFAPTTDSWKDANFSYCYMDKTHRATDPRLAKILSKMSRDIVDGEVKTLINSRMKLDREPGRLYTTLFTTNRNVDKYNQEQLNINTKPLVRIPAKGSGLPHEVKKLYKSYSIPEYVELKVGATVLLTANTTISGKFYANGSLGEIVSTKLGVPQIKFNTGDIVTLDRKVYAAVEKKSYFDKALNKEIQYEKELARVEQVPLKLGYAITVHKSQGQTFDGVVVNLSKCFAAGLGYVALSRVRSLDDLIVQDINDGAYKIDPKSKALSNFVKKKALLGRHAFIKERGEYELLLTNHLYRLVLWDASTSGSARRPKKK